MYASLDPLNAHRMEHTCPSVGSPCKLLATHVRNAFLCSQLLAQPWPAHAPLAQNKSVK